MFLLGFINNLFEGPSGFIILLLALLFFGAKRLPELARGLGSAINEFNKAKDDVHRQITQAVEPPPAAPVQQLATPVQPAPAPVAAEPPLPQTLAKAAGGEAAASRPANPSDSQPKA